MKTVNETVGNMSEQIRNYRTGSMDNPFQGKAPRVLFVCSMGLLRSPTASQVAHRRFGWNTRCAGVCDEACQPVNPSVLDWADRVYCMNAWHESELVNKYGCPLNKIVNLDIEDEYEYMNPELVAIIEHKLEKIVADDYKSRTQ